MELVNLAGIYAGTFLFCAGSGIVPVMNAELFVIYLGATAKQSQLPLLVLLAAVGQMSAKVVLYYAGRGVVKLPLGRWQGRVDGLGARLGARGRATEGVTFLSAVTGLPSFYGISVLAGTLGWSLPRFLVVGVIGRILHFAVLVFLPGLVKGIL